jgi:hypothetical protein
VCHDFKSDSDVSEFPFSWHLCITVMKLLNINHAVQLTNIFLSKGTAISGRLKFYFNGI